MSNMNESNSQDDLNHKMELVSEYKKQLKILELKAAKFGMHVPVYIEREIQDIRDKIYENGGVIEVSNISYNSKQPSQSIQYEICSLRKHTQTVKAGLWNYKNFTKTILYLEAEGPFGKYIVAEPAITEEVEVFEQSTEYNLSKTNIIRGGSIGSNIQYFGRQLALDGWESLSVGWRRIVTYSQLPSSTISISDINRMVTEPYKPKGFAFAQLSFAFSIIKILCILAVIIAIFYYLNNK
jgi:hypothetical protein